MKTINVLFLFLIGANVQISAKKIIMVLPQGTRSYLIFYESVAKGLAAKGHQIDFYTIFHLSKPIPNVNEHFLDLGTVSSIDENQRGLFAPTQKSPLFFFVDFSDSFVTNCDKFFSNPQIKALTEELKLKGPIYDVAIVNLFASDCILPFGYLAAKHVIMLEVHSTPYWLSYYLNIPSPPSIVPDVFNHFVPPMTFKERFINTISSNYYWLHYTYKLIPDMQVVVDKYLPKGTPTIMDGLKEISFVLDLSDPFFTTPRPSVPFLTGIGGIHLRKAEPLPKELEDFMRSSGKDGVIVFAMGSYVKAKYLPVEVRNTFLAVFAKLKQKVLWKFEKQIEGLPPNVKIVQWMPQHDVLGHPNTRLFLTHSGRFSLLEAVYHAVPVIGIPLFGDQPHNINIVKQFGFGEELSILNVTEKGLSTLITEILNNKRYSDKAKEASSILRDRLNSPTDTAVYWTEYVMRHNGAKHLKNLGAEQLNIFQYFLVDVFAVLFLCLMIGIVVIAAGVTFIWRMCFKRLIRTPKQKRN